MNTLIKKSLLATGLDNMENYRELYLKKMNRLGSTPYDRGLKAKQREFNRFFEMALNKEECYIDGVKTHAIFQDHSQSNNKDLSDDKYVIVPNSTKANVGSYINWRSQDWLVFTEEVKTIPTHQQMKIKIVNTHINWLDNDGIVRSYGAYVQNQTLYTLGVAFQGDLISVVDGKMMMYMQNNEHTDSIKIGSRVFIGHSVFKILFADEISRNGLINFLMEEDTITENDNRELGIADYWNRVPATEEDNEHKELPQIVGSETAKIGSTHTFSISDGTEVEEWNIETIDGSTQPFYLLERNTEMLTLQFKNDFRFVGETVNIIAKLSSGDYVSLPVRLTKRF